VKTPRLKGRKKGIVCLSASLGRREAECFGDQREHSDDFGISKNEQNEQKKERRGCMTADQGKKKSQELNTVHSRERSGIAPSERNCRPQRRVSWIGPEKCERYRASEIMKDN